MKESTFRSLDSVVEVVSRGSTVGKEQRNAGRIEEELKQLTRDMTINALGAMSGRGVLVSERERTALQRCIHEHVTRSVEIEAALALVIEREDGPEAA